MEMVGDNPLGALWPPPSCSVRRLSSTASSVKQNRSSSKSDEKSFGFFSSFTVNHDKGKSTGNVSYSTPE